jgi:MFS family permease
MRRNHVETRHDRAELAHDAGKRKMSFVSVLAGTLVAYGAFAVLAAIAAAVAKGVGFETDLSTNEWEQLGVAGGAVVAVVLFASYYFGGYVAGRMARRAGSFNGFMVFVLGVVLAVGVTALVTMFTDTDDVLRNLRSIGVPT